ncbi:MAG: hypothetical protein IJ662_01080 [Clostridia bacterium]|nr:hypothetical protein [Clostridia bacterium]
MLDMLPQRPVISRFVAPWDTSGWYFMQADLAPGKAVYSNADIRITDMPDALLGCDYIVTYDSASCGFDDKQEVDFFVERTAEIYVALDGQADASFLTGFSQTDWTVVTSTETVYRLFLRRYDAGAQVHIPGFSGPGRHFFVIARAADADAPADVPAFPAFPVTERHVSIPCAWYVHDCFNALPTGSAPAGYACDGAVTVRPWADQPRRKHVRIADGGCLRCHAETTGQDQAEAALTVVSGSVSVTLDDVSILLSNKRATLANGTPLGDPLDGEFVVAFKRFPRRQHCEIWINCRPAAEVPSRCATVEELIIRVGNDSEALLDRLDWQDQTDVPCVDAAFDALPTALRAVGTVAPFSHRALESCLHIDGMAAYPFPAIEGEARIEITVRPNGAAPTLLPEVRDRRGRTLLKVAMYCNNLYISDGGQWRRIVEGLAPWQYYPAGNWYHLALTLDFAARTFSVVVDGACRARDFALAGEGCDAAQLVFAGDLDLHTLRVWDRQRFSLLPPGPLFDPRAFGAAGDGIALDTQAIQKALNAAAYTGGTVLLREGIFLSRMLRLTDDVTLWVDETAELLAAPDFEAYPLLSPGENLCAVRQLGRALIYGEHVRNVRVTGGGLLNANGRCRFKLNDPASDNRPFAARPDHLYIAYSQDIQARDLRLCNAAFWTVVPLSSRMIVMEHLDLDCMNTPNRDGIDPVDCTDITVRRCRIMAGDDGFCLKTADRMGCRNLFADELVIQSLASGIKIGTDSYACAENILIRRCIVKNVNRCGIALETVDGASIRNVRLEQIDMTDCGGPLYLTIGRRNRRATGFPQRQSEMEDITIRRVSYQKPYAFSRCKTIYESLIIGDPQVNPIRRVVIAESDFTLPGGYADVPPAPHDIGTVYPEYDQHGLSSGAAFCIRYAQDVQINDCVLRLERPDVRPLIARHEE